MLLVAKVVAVLGLAATTTSWVAFQQNSVSNPGVTVEMARQEKQGSTEASPNICLSGCNFFSAVASAH